MKEREMEKSERVRFPPLLVGWEWGALLCLLSLIVPLMVWPEWDIVVSGLFYSKETGFVRSPLLTFIRNSLPYWIGGAVGFTYAMTKCGRAARRALLFIVLVFAVGPGLVVNGVFKEHWGRARPSQIEAFGGQARFTPAWLPSDQCDRNCSFTAGDPSVGFAFVAFAFVWPKRRRAIIAGSLAAGFGLGLVRIAQGGHFASDVLFTWLVTTTTTALLAVLLRPEERTADSSR